MVLAAIALAIVALFLPLVFVLLLDIRNNTDELIEHVRGDDRT